MAGPNRNGRTRRQRRNADNLKAARLQPCRRCGQDIDYDAPPGHPNSFQAGHIKSYRDYPELRDDPANLQPEHWLCGSSAHTSENRDTGTVSRHW